MMTTVRYRSALLQVSRTPLYAKTAFSELSFVCLWSVVGLTLSALLFAMGLADGIGQALAIAG